MKAPAAHRALAIAAVDAKIRKGLGRQRIADASGLSVADPEGGECTVITLDGKCLPTKSF